MTDEIVHDLTPRNNVYPAVNSEDRAHIGDETCWCRPHASATTITHRPLIAGSDEAIADMVRFIADNGGAVEVNGVRIENLDQYNREDDKAQFAMNEARARIAELEAAQRPPLGYAVTVDDGSGGRWVQAGAVLPTPEEAVSRAWFYRPADARAVELREVQP